MARVTVEIKARDGASITVPEGGKMIAHGTWADADGLFVLCTLEIDDGLPPTNYSLGKCELAFADDAAREADWSDVSEYVPGPVVATLDFSEIPNE